ncbi:MAG: anthranilate phosphoribosyltransferase, partial [Phototrophicales bacterium]
YAIGPRKQMAIRTIFNLLGPITNPANVKQQVLGVFDQSLCRPLAEVLGRLGSTHVLVVHAQDGLDEITINGKTYVAELKNAQVSEYTIEPSDFGLESQSLDGLQVTSAQDSLNLIKSALGNKTDSTSNKARQIIALNSG